MTAGFAIRGAVASDADAIARVSAQSWRSSYRGLLPDSVLDQIDVAKRAAKRRTILADASIYQLVACDAATEEIVGFCDAGASRQPALRTGEIYALYLIDRAKRRRLGSQMFEQARSWLRERGMTSLRVWVLENNTDARRFYEALGGRTDARKRSTIGGHDVTELAYVWPAQERAP